jgi:hypothetical protein
MRKFFLLSLIVSPVCFTFAEEVLPSPVPITREEKARIYSEFKKKLSEEERDFERQVKIKRRELVKMQNERRKDWREKEKKARREFFEAHTSGPDRRHYVQDFVKRKKEFDANEKKEWVEFKRKQNEDHKAFRISRQERSRLVNDSLDRNVKPDL